MQSLVVNLLDVSILPEPTREALLKPLRNDPFTLLVDDLSCSIYSFESESHELDYPMNIEFLPLKTEEELTGIFRDVWGHPLVLHDLPDGHGVNHIVQQYSTRCRDHLGRMLAAPVTYLTENGTSVDNDIDLKTILESTTMERSFYEEFDRITGVFGQIATATLSQSLRQASNMRKVYEQRCS